MGGDLIPRSIEMARAVREQNAGFSPGELHKASSGRVDIYRHAMIEAGYIINVKTQRPYEICPECGYDFGYTGSRTMTPLDPSEHEAMIAARCDHVVRTKQDNELARIEREVFEAGWRRARDFYVPRGEQSR